ncbi:MAG: MFS transporter [Planctomycetota bacterium]|mgnify:CR=1 FL=1|nr:MAG: MFS transporter [Planctomycetota bacterium]
MSIALDTLQENAATDRPRRASAFYYGWVMLPLTMAALVASSPGQTFGVSIFNEPMRLSLGLSYGQLAAAYMIGTLLGALPITYVGSLMDRYGGRRVVLGVLSLFCGACLVVSLVQNWLMLILAFSLLRMLGPGALAFTSGNTLPYWFERRLGMVEGIRQLGMGLAMLLIPTINLYLVHHWGWRGAYAFLGLVIWSVLFPLFFFLFRSRPEDVGHALDGAAPEESNAPQNFWWGLTLEETLRTFSFWVVTAGTACFALIHTAVFFCLVPIFDERGLTHQDAATALTVYAGCLAVMQLTSGTLSDRMPPRFLLFAGLLGLTLGVSMVRGAESVGTAVLATSVLGLSQGLFFGAAQPLWARYFGRRHLGKIRGVLVTLNVASSSLGPLVAGLSRDATGDFNLALLLFLLAPLPVAAMTLFAAPPQRDEDSVPVVATPATAAAR